MKLTNTQKTVLDYCVMLFMGLLMALNYQVFILNNAFAPAGINGLATMAQYLFHFSIGYSSLLINLPLAVIVFFRVDKLFSSKTLVLVMAFSGFLLLLQRNPAAIARFVYHTEDGRSTLLAPVAAGIINGFIYGVAIRCGASTGGTDYIAAIVRRHHPQYSLTHIVFALNCAVAALSYFVYDANIEPVLLCIFYCYLTTAVSDRIIQGAREALKVEMITSQPEIVTQTLIHELHHSVTILHAEGGYSHKEKVMLICVINKHQYARFLQVISAFPDTFACVSSVSDTVGNFKHYRS